MKSIDTKDMKNIDRLKGRGKNEDRRMEAMEIGRTNWEKEGRKKWRNVLRMEE